MAMASTATMADSGPSRAAQSEPWIQDDTTPLFVAAAVTVLTATGAAAGASIGMFNERNPFSASATMGGRWFMASSTFYGLREYIISPFLTRYEVSSTHAILNQQISAKRQGKLPDLNDPTLELTRWQTRTQRVLDSGLTGGLVGGGAVWIIGGPRRAVRGGFSGMVAGSILQFSANSLRMLKRDIFDPPKPRLTPNTIPLSPSNLPVDTQMPSTPVNPSEQPNQSLWKRFTHATVKTLKAWSPIKKRTNEEMLVMYQAKRKALDERLIEIEAEELELYERIQEWQRQAESSGSTRHLV
ncbi:hypothetical protein BD324DRAFT_616615 [Kockovaella imperatae]|uniref:Uncharacterized protein n=1 Tax=Kockovaella imperatae TaxID=4999 RepID=A0A1Y1USI1_9TREE|nr:hypothetical protein BD324DRAFT_616615 [Kockovaella imperatae]ORX40155.1 hypothetical protein BD324DRAFT_616615 [Kockovaella imperatae]